MQSTTITYHDGVQILDESFSSDERVQQWIVLYPEYKILEITYDVID